MTYTFDHSRSELCCHKSATHSHTTTAASVSVTCSVNSVTIQKTGSNIYCPVLTNVTITLILWKPLVKAWSHILQPPSCSLTGLVYKACSPLPLRSVSLQIRLGHLPMTSRKKREKDMYQYLNRTETWKYPPNPKSKKKQLSCCRYESGCDFDNLTTHLEFNQDMEWRRSGFRNLELFWKVRRHSFILFPWIDPQKRKKKKRKFDPVEMSDLTSHGGDLLINHHSKQSKHVKHTNQF